MKNKIIPIKDIVIDESLYPRVASKDSTIKEYFMAMKKGDVFPNIDVAKFKGLFYLIDGKHRIEAYKLKGEKYVTCDVRNAGNLRDIFLASIRANLKHGVRYNTRDKVKIAGRLERMKVDIKDISDLLDLKFKNVNRILIKQKRPVKFMGTLGSKVISETKKKKEESSDSWLKMNEAEFEESQLDDMLDFLKNREFTLHKKKLTSRLLKIQKEIKRLLK